MKNIYIYLFSIFLILPINGCSWLATSLTPMPVVDSVARGRAISKISIQNPPEGEDLKSYLHANAELWKELSKWFELE